MNLQEFKAWFEGFTEDMDKAPNAKQWKRIKERVAEITAQPTEVRYFYDHYWRPYYTQWPYGTITCSSGNSAAYSANASAQVMQLSCAAEETGFINSTQAFTMLGKADAHALQTA